MIQPSDKILADENKQSFYESSTLSGLFAKWDKVKL